MKTFSPFLILFFFVLSCKKHYHLSGSIADNLSYRFIENAHIHSGNRILASTNKYGEFEFNWSTRSISKSRVVSFQISAEGYHNIKQEIKLQDSLNIDIELQNDFNDTDIRINIMDTVKAIAKNNFISSGVVGYAAKRPKQFNQRRWLMKKASDDELVQLIKYPHPGIKISAFKALYYRQHKIVPDILQSLATDNSEILFSSGCLSRPIFVNEYCFQNIMRYRLPNSPPLPPPPFNSPQLIKLDSILLNQIKQTIIETNENLKNI